MSGKNLRGLVCFVFVFSTPNIIINILNLAPSEKMNRISAQCLSTILSFISKKLLWIPIFLSLLLSYHYTRSKVNFHDIMTKFFSLLFGVLLLPSLNLLSMDGMFAGILIWLFSEHEIPTRWHCIFLPENNAFYVNYMIQSLLIETAIDLIRFKEMFYYLKGMEKVRFQRQRAL